jgi:tetrapyrrole methylase family protein/MazG family protein
MLQVMLHAQIGEDEGYFSIDDVIRDISAKMVRRHPHVFKDVKVQDEHDVVANWEEIKKAEKQTTSSSLLDSVPKTLPSLAKAAKLQKKAAKTGFDWDDVQDIWDKVNEELKEFSAEASAESADEVSLKAEFGDVLFALVNIGRYYKIEPEEALAMTNDKFRRRFSYIEKEAAAKGLELTGMSLEEMDKLWDEAKEMERRF